jgi:cytochrome c biogenesis protein CcmG/thiol:disulfide interchange protein DsbE
MPEMGCRPHVSVCRAARRGYTFTVLLDTDDRVADAYGVQGIPHTLVVDRKGEIHFVPGGPEALEDLVRELLRK